MNKKSNVKQLNRLQRRIDTLTKKVNANAPVAISSKNGNKYRDYYLTRGKERISDVSALTTSYSCVNIFINPANASLFPWLSGIAKKYDKYHFKRLVFRYKPCLPTSEGGNVYIGIDYNTLDPAPQSSNQFCQMTHWTTNVVWKPNELAVDLKNVGWLYTRLGPVPNADYKTYDLGRLFVAIEGVSYNQPVGYMEVDYEVELMNRQPDYISTTPVTSDRIILSYYDTNGTGFSEGSNAKFSDLSFKVDTTEGALDLSTDTITVLAPGTYEIGIISSATTRSVITLVKSGTNIAYLGNGTVVIDFDLNDTLKLFIGSGGITMYSFYMVKLN